LEGFNAVCGLHRKARIGIHSNNEDDCDRCDSRIGFGTAGPPYNANTCGNEAEYGEDNGDKYIKALGYILGPWNKKALKATLSYSRFNFFVLVSPYLSSISPLHLKFMLS